MRPTKAALRDHYDPQFPDFNTDYPDQLRADEFLNEVQKICATIDVQAIEKLAGALAALRTGGGRLFLLGVGGSAGNASHGSTLTPTPASTSPKTVAECPSSCTTVALTPYSCIAASMIGRLPDA